MLYKYFCEECGVSTYVEWKPLSKENYPYCGSCGMDDQMVLEAEVEIFEEREVGS